MCTQVTTDLGDSDIISDPGKLSVVQGKGRTEGRKGREEAAEVKALTVFAEDQVWSASTATCTGKHKPT